MKVYTAAERASNLIRDLWLHALHCPRCRTHPFMQGAGWDVQAAKCMREHDSPEVPR